MNRIGNVASLLLSFSISFGFPSHILIAQNAEKANQQKDVTADQGKELRDVFLGKETASTPSRRLVGRLGVLLETGEFFSQVRADYSFRSGDRFRFEVTSNRNGWLYVLHAAPGAKLKQLWPRDRDDNAIKSGQTYEIPQKPGVFIFDEEVGQEYFYVAIRPNQIAPDLDMPQPADKPPSQDGRVAGTPAKKEGADITNFVVRDPFGETSRGVVFDPGKEDSDPFLYFSVGTKGKGNSATIEFRLRHVE